MPSPPIPIRRQRPDPGSLNIHGSRRRRLSQNPGSSSVSHDLNKMDEFKDLMNDWEINGHQNKWVCPSDRHLQLRAQLKSGWSCRTATARSPTTVKQQNPGAISDAEQEQIRKVLARAEAGRQNEQERIGKMVDRLEKMKLRATGNGVTQCLICQTEFGLLSSKSYAAMCIDCRKYVCQKNCGVETFDQKRGEMIFLCKICSEYREVMWKKSGAWFYKEMPTYVKPPELPYNNNTANGGYLTGQSNMHPSTSQHHVPSPTPAWPFQAATGYRTDPSSMVSNPMNNQISHGMNAMNLNNDPSNFNSTGRQRQLPIPPDQQQRLKTVPRPRITPSWVHDKVQSSMSIGSEDDESSTSSVDPDEFKQSVNSIPSGVPAPIPSSRRHTHKRELKHSGNSTGSFSSTLPTNSASTSARNSMQRYNLTSKSRITDTEESENDESRRTTPSTSPRHSLATPSSYGGDDISQNHITLATHETSDAKSIDSGVVQSDHSIQLRQPFITPGQGTTAPVSASISPPPKSNSQNAQLLRSMGNTVPAQLSSNLGSTLQSSALPQQSSPTSQQSITPRPSSGLNQNMDRESSLSILNAPPIPPRTANFGVETTDRRPSSTSISTNNSQIRSSPRFPSNPTSSHESLSTSQAVNSPRLSSSIDQNITPRQQLNSRDSLSIAPLETEQVAESPTFMSSPDEDDDSSTLGSIQFNLTYLGNEKQLIIHLIRAKNLKAADKNGFSDPYVKFHLIPGNVKATKLTSKTIEKSLNPEWNEELIYYGIMEEERQKKTLRVTVLDRDRIGSDFLGETRVALRKLPMNQTKKFNLYLEHAMPAPSEKAEEIERGKILVGITYNIQQGSLFVNIKRCAELLGMDQSGLSDPYCKVSLTPLSSKMHRQRTQIKKRTLNPEFNENLQFIVPFKDLPRKALEIKVYDHDVGRHDDFIGGILLSTAASGDRGTQWKSAVENPGKTFEMWHKLESD